MGTTTITKSLDRKGKTIATYVVYDAMGELADMAEGDVLELVTDDYEPIARDVAAWCATRGHALLASDPGPDGRSFLIRKGSARAPGAKLAMVLSSAGLEELLSPLAFALAAALEGMDVHLYVQGPAVRVLRRGFRPKLSGWARPFSRLAAARMAESGHIAARDKLRQLRELGGSIYVCGPSMQHFKVAADDLIFDGLPMVEYLSFMAVMADADVQLYI